MLQRFLTWIRGVFTKMLHINDAKRSLKVDVAISTEMQAAIDQWAMMFIDRAPWLDDTTQSLGLPAAIAGEIARLTTVELESSITGSARADYLQGEYERVLNELRSQVETAAAGGGLVFKPYVDGERIAVDCVPAWRFLPTAFNSRGEVTGAVFVEQVTRGKTYYTRMEHHQLTDDGYNIRNLAYSSLSQGTLGNPCSLAAVDEWADLEPELTIRYKDGTAPEGVLFAYFRLPFSNTVDPESPLGVSVYSRAVGLIREADRQYSRILWEYEGSELAIDASQGALQVSGPDGRPATLPPRSKRLFRELAIDQGQSGDLYKVFNPAHLAVQRTGQAAQAHRVQLQPRLRHAVRSTGCGQDRRGDQEQQAAFLLRCVRRAESLAERTRAPCLGDGLLRQPVQARADRRVRGQLHLG